MGGCHCGRQKEPRKKQWQVVWIDSVAIPYVELHYSISCRVTFVARRTDDCCTSSGNLESYKKIMVLVDLCFYVNLIVN